MSDATLSDSPLKSILDSPLRPSPALSSLKYDNDDNFYWESGFCELKDFLDDLLDIPGDAEINTDKVHNATTYKKKEFTVRFYHTSKKLKLYGTGGQRLMKLLQEKHQNETQQEDRIDDQEEYTSILMSPMTTLTPIKDQGFSDDNNRLIAQRLDDMCQEILFIKSHLLGSQENNVEIETLKAEISMHKQTISKLEREKESLVETISILMKNNETNSNQTSGTTTRPNITIADNGAASTSKTKQRKNKNNKRQT